MASTMTLTPRLVWSLVTVCGLLLLAVALAVLTGSPAHAAEMARFDAAAPLPAANGGVSDGDLAVAIVLPLVFGGLLAATIGWAVMTRSRPGKESDYVMPWWRTAAWYGRRDETPDE